MKRGTSANLVLSIIGIGLLLAIGPMGEYHTCGLSAKVHACTRDASCECGGAALERHDHQAHDDSDGHCIACYACSTLRLVSSVGLLSGAAPLLGQLPQPAYATISWVAPHDSLPRAPPI